MLHSPNIRRVLARFFSGLFRGLLMVATGLFTAAATCIALLVMGALLPFWLFFSLIGWVSMPSLSLQA